MNAAFGDIFNDGRLSIYKTNISEPGVLVQANDLWVPKKTRPGALEYENLASSLGVDLGGWSWGAQFGDLNNDGTLDLYLVNGYVSAGERSSYWYDFARDRRRAQRHHRRRDELAGDEGPQPVRLPAQARVAERRRSAGSPTSPRSSARPTRSTAARWRSPISRNRGVLDVIVANQRGSAAGLQEHASQPGRHWIDVRARGHAPATAARSAPASELQWDGRTQVQEVSGGSGFSAQNERRLHYGLGASHGRRAASSIRWPSGRAADRSTHPPGSMR